MAVRWGLGERALCPPVSHSQEPVSQVPSPSIAHLDCCYFPPRARLTILVGWLSLSEGDAFPPSVHPSGTAWGRPGDVFPLPGGPAWKKCSSASAGYVW